MGTKYFIVGGAGFIGSHFVDRLLAEEATERVTIFDNFSSGRDWHYSSHRESPRFQALRGDAGNPFALTPAMQGHDVVIHLAANHDTARASTDADIDFREGTMLTNNVVEAMRCSGVRTILYASSSCVYGDAAATDAKEDVAPLQPVSTYGASKVAGEALLMSYCHMFGFQARAFRFANVVGPRQTHGVCLDFVRRLRQDPKRLLIRGDGGQSKSYVDAEDVVSAVLLAASHATAEPFAVYNVGSGDYVTVSQIAEMAVECLGLTAGSVAFEYTGGSRGWTGDVATVRLNTERIRALGWQPARCSCQALQRSIMWTLANIEARLL